MRGFTRQRTPGALWTAYWSVVDPGTGKRVQHTRGGFKTKAEASKHLNAVLPKVDAGPWKPDQPLTVKQLLEEHWMPRSGPGSSARRPSTSTGASSSPGSCPSSGA